MNLLQNKNVNIEIYILCLHARSMRFAFLTKKGSKVERFEESVTHTFRSLAFSSWKMKTNLNLFLRLNTKKL